MPSDPSPQDGRAPTTPDATASPQGPGRGEGDPEGLRATNAFLEAILESLPAIVMVKDAADLRIVRVNRAAEEALGLPREEVLGHTEAEILPEPEAAGRARRDRDVLEKGTRHQVLLEPLSTPRRGQRWINTTSVPIPGPDGRPRYLLSISSDITDELPERRRAREGLARLAAIVASSDDAIIGTDLEGRVRSWTPAAERIFGWRAEEAAGQALESMETGERRGEIAATLERVRDGEGGSQLEIPLRRKDGRTVELSVSVAPLLLDGDLVGMSVVARDITARRQAEERFRVAVESAPNAVVMVRADGTIVLVNAETERLFGYARDELLGTSVDVLVPMPYRRSHPEHRRDFFQDPRARAMGAGRDLHGLRRDGREVPVEIGLAPIDTSEGPCVLASVVDITERKRAEAALRARTAELERSNRELERFATVASHDLQEPLRMITTYLQLLERRYHGKLDEDATSFIQFAADGARRMHALIRDLLAFSRMGRGDLVLEPTPLGPVMDVALVDLGPAIAESGATVTRDELPTVRGHADLLRQVFQNLIGNAIKFRRDEPPRVHVTATRDGPMWRISVEDNGLGIESEYRERIFEIFQRLHPAGRYPGTGVGLALCRRIVENHGGRIWLDSVPDEGTTFHFTVPAARPEPGRPEEEAR